jgi:hypothetical protein
VYIQCLMSWNKHFTNLAMNYLFVWHFTCCTLFPFCILISLHVVCDFWMFFLISVHVWCFFNDFFFMVFMIFDDFLNDVCYFLHLCWYVLWCFFGTCFVFFNFVYLKYIYIYIYIYIHIFNVVYRLVWGYTIVSTDSKIIV